MTTPEQQDIETRIIEAAKLVFSRKGYEATKMGDIAQEVGISRTAMHYYFRTKEMLFEAILGRLLSILIPNFDAIVSEPTSCLEKIPKIVSTYITVIRANPTLPLFVVNEFQRDPEHMIQIVQKNANKATPILRFQQQLLDEMERGLVRKVPLVYTVSTLLSLVLFPMLVKYPLKTFFLEGEDDKFDAFIEERKGFVSQLIVQMLTPEPNQ